MNKYLSMAIGASIGGLVVTAAFGWIIGLISAAFSFTLCTVIDWISYI